MDVGLFDFLRRKPKPPAEPPAPPTPPAGLSPWQLSLWQAERDPGFAWRDDNQPARALVHWLLERVAPVFGNGKIVDGEPVPFATIGMVHIAEFGLDQVQREHRNPELRGICEGIPVRIPVSIPARRVWTIEMRCDEKARFFRVERDLARIPRPADPSDPWAKSGPQCMFLGKGIFLDDSDPKQTQEWLVPNWQSLPPAARELVVQTMERLDLRFFELSNANSALYVLGNRTLDQLEDPIAYLHSCGAFLAEMVRQLALTAGPSPALSRQAPAPRVTCSYCSSIFILSAGKNTCPNCGAAAGL